MTEYNFGTYIDESLIRARSAKIGHSFKNLV